MAEQNSSNSEFDSEEDMVAYYKQLEAKFRLACRQIVLLNNKVDDLQVRYNRSMKADRRSFRYTLRLSLATLEGLRNMFYEYACRRGDELDKLQERLVQSGLLSDEDEEDDLDDGRDDDSSQNATTSAPSADVVAPGNNRESGVTERANNRMDMNDMEWQNS